MHRTRRLQILAAPLSLSLSLSLSAGLVLAVHTLQDVHLVMRIYVDAVVAAAWLVAAVIAVRWKHVGEGPAAPATACAAERRCTDREFLVRARRHSSHWV